MTTTPVRDALPKRSAGSLVGVVLTLFGLVAGLVDYWLVQAARSYCNAAAATEELGALLLIHLPSRLLLGPLLGGVGYLACRLLLLGVPAIRRSPRGQAIRTIIAGLVAFGAVIAMVLIDFSTVGTLDGYPADANLCPATNVPPWWPSWLPA
jgi:hypothetical protein